MRSIDEGINRIFEDKITQLSEVFERQLTSYLMKNSRFITKDKFREMYKVGNETIDNLVGSGKLTRTKFDSGRNYYYDLKEIEEVLEKNKQYF